MTDLHCPVKKDGPMVNNDLYFDVSHLFLFFPPVANAEGYFNAEIAPVEVKAKKGKEMFSVDEHPRQTTIEKLSSLPPVFKENGTVSAGNASVRERKNHSLDHYFPLFLLPYFRAFAMELVLLL